MAASEELRAAMNHRMLDVLQRREQRDWFRYGMSRREQEAIPEKRLFMPPCTAEKADE
jgi:hypothetical protein